MPNPSPFPSSKQDRLYSSRRCPNCGSENADWARVCVQCGRNLPAPEAAAQAEIGHIRYLLRQLPDWQARDLLTPLAAERLRTDYAARLTERFDFLERGQRAPQSDSQSAPPMQHSAFVQPPMIPALPPTANGKSAAPQNEAPSAVVRDVRPESHRQPSAPSTPPSDGLRVFFRENALKIVFALAAVMVLVALRSLLAWEQMDRYILLSIPAGMFALTGMFWTFGQKTRAENPWAAFAYHGLEAVLVAFDVLAANKYWLFGALPAIPALLAASAAATVTAGGLLLRWKEIPYLHLFQIGALITLNAALQTFGAGPTVPILISAGAHLLYAAGCLGVARTCLRGKASASSGKPSVPADGEETVRPGTPASAGMWTAAWTLWAHLAVILAVALSAVRLVTHGGGTNEYALLALFAGLIYAGGAQALGAAWMVPISGLFVLGSGVLWLPEIGMTTWSGFDFLLLALSAAALVMAAYNGRASEADRTALAAAYRLLAQIGVGLAAALVWLHALTTLADPSAASRDALANIVLAVLCGGYYLGFTHWERQPAFLYSALSVWGVGIADGLAWLHAPMGSYALAATLYGILLCSVASYSRRASSSRSEPAPPLDWRTPCLVSGQAAAGIGALLAVILPIQYGLAAAWGWTAATLTLNAALYAATARKEASEPVAYAALFCIAASASLAAWRLLPKPVSLADCLTPFMLTAAISTVALAVRAARSRTKDANGAGRERSLWREPTACMVLIAITLSLGDVLIRFLAGAPSPHPLLSCLPVLMAATLTAASRREPGDDPLRTWAMTGLIVGAILETALLAGMRGGFAAWNASSLRACGVELVLLGWGWWGLGQSVSHRLREKDVWSGELILGGLATAFLSALVVTLAATRPGVPSGLETVWAELCLAGAFALLLTDTAARKSDDGLAASLLIVIMAGIVNAGMLRSTLTPFLLPTVTLMALAAAGAYFVLSRQSGNAAGARLAALPLFGGWALVTAWRAAGHFTSLERDIADALWIAGGLAAAWAYVRTARRFTQSAFAYAASITLTCAVLQTITTLLNPQTAWIALLLLPFLVALYVLGACVSPADNALLGEPARRTALAVSGLALLWSAGNGDGIFGMFGPAGAFHPTAAWLTTLTLAAYGAAYASLAAYRRTPQAVGMGAGILTAAYLHYLLTRTPLLHGAPDSGFSWPHVAFLFVQAGVFWLILGWHGRKSWHWNDLAAPLLDLAKGIALCAAAIGLAAVQTHGEGRWTVLALGWAGAIWFGLWLLEQGEWCLHMGTWNLLAAWGLILYDRYGANFALLDIYLLPVTLYLITVGHMASSRQRQEEARYLWWAGLLLCMTPTFLAHWNHAAPWHTALLLVECLAAVLWGIGQRIRAFVCAGLAFAAAYAASAVVGRLPEMWGTLVSLGIGVGLFAAGFYALTHRETVQRWAAIWEARWQAWLAWR